MISRLAKVFGFSSNRQLRSRKNRSSNSGGKKNGEQRLSVETLEPRQMLAVTVFSDDFSTDPNNNYDVVATEGNDGSHMVALVHDATGERAQVDSEDNGKVTFEKTGLTGTNDGTFSIDFNPTVSFPYDGSLSIRLQQDANNYYEIRNTDGGATGAIKKFVNGNTTPVETVSFANNYNQNTNYAISIDFSPTQILVTGFGSPLTLNTTDTTSIDVNSFKVEANQQTAYFDNILLEETSPILFSDDFSTDTTGNYTVDPVIINGNTFALADFLYDSGGDRAQVDSDDNEGLVLSQSDLTATDSGTFSIDFNPTVSFPIDGSLSIRLRQDANNYYEIRNTDGGATGAIKKFVGGVEVQAISFANNYNQGTNYEISIDFSPTQVAVTGFGAPLMLDTSANSDSIDVDTFEVEAFQQTAYFDNILLTDSGSTFGGTSPVEGWVTITGDAGFSGGSAATNAPVTTDADGDVIAANFSTTTLANDGDFIELTGSISLDVPLVAEQFRWGLFDGDNPVTAGDGTGYVGYWIGAPLTNPSFGRLGSANGSGTNPFSSSATTQLATASGTEPVVAANTPLAFVLTIVKNGANANVSGSITDGAAYNVTWSVTDTAPSPGSLTYDSAAFLMGGSLDGGAATFSNIEVATGSGASGDTQAPSVPTDLSATPSAIGSSKQVDLSWTASTDNVGVTGYTIYRDGSQTATNVTTTTYSDTGLAAGTYSYTVAAYDMAGNLSAQSEAIVVTTTNLADDTTKIADSQNFTTSSPVTGLWDDDTSGGAGTTAASSDNSYWVEYDLGEIHDLSQVRLFGDAGGNWVSNTYSVGVRTASSGSYTDVITDANARANQWFETSLNTQAQFVKLTVVGDPGKGVQAYEFEVYGTPTGQTATGNTYYVGPGETYTTIQAAVTSGLQPGDTVIVRAGTYGPVNVSNLHGTAANPITIKNFQNDVVTVDGKTARHAMVFESSSYVIVDGFNLWDSDPQVDELVGKDPIADFNRLTEIKNVTGNGIKFSNSHHMTIQNSDIFHTGSHGVLGTNSNNTTVFNNTIHTGIKSLSSYGVYLTGPGNIIRGNTVHHNTGEGLQLGNNTPFTDSIVENNIVYDNGGEAWLFVSSGVPNKKVGASNIKSWYPNSTNNIIQNNILYYTDDYRNDNPLTDGDNKSDNLVIGSEGNAGTGFIGTTIVNNTAYGAPDKGIRFHRDAKVNILRNNISWGNGGQQIGVTGNADLANQTVSNNLTTDPLFVNVDPLAGAYDFHLQYDPNANPAITSPAIDYGTATDAPLVDIEGNPRPQGTSHDVGAYESSGSSLRAAEGEASPGHGTPINATALAPIVEEAIRRWDAAGFDAAVLEDVNVAVGSLGGDQLATRSGNSITIDTDAAGYGWFVDRTPGRDNEYVSGEATRGVASRRVDLLTVVSHELGHVLGLPHDADMTVMHDTLEVGQRRTAHEEPGKVSQTSKGELFDAALATFGGRDGLPTGRQHSAAAQFGPEALDVLVQGFALDRRRQRDLPVGRFSRDNEHDFGQTERDQEEIFDDLFADFDEVLGPQL